MNTHETYVSIEVAKLLKQAGFDWPTRYSYDLYLYSTEGEKRVIDDFASTFCNEHNGLASMPTFDVVQRWLREVKNIHITIGFKNIDRITYTSIVYELIVDENSELVMPEIGTIHFCPNNLFFRGETKEYENPDDALSDAILLALKYLTLEKSEYSEYYTNYLKGK